MNWKKEIVELAYGFRINTLATMEIIDEVDSLSVPQGKSENDWKYDRAHSRLLPLIMSI